MTDTLLDELKAALAEDMARNQQTKKDEGRFVNVVNLGLPLSLTVGQFTNRSVQIIGRKDLRYINPLLFLSI